MITAAETLKLGEGENLATTTLTCDQEEPAKIPEETNLHTLQEDTDKVPSTTTSTKLDNQELPTAAETPMLEEGKKLTTHTLTCEQEEAAKMPEETNLQTLQ